MSILIQKIFDREIFDRLYQLFCYETGEGVMGEDALYPVPDGVVYIVEQCGIPCGFAIFSAERCLERLFLLKKHRESGIIKEILTKLFDENVGEWSVPYEFENCVREYTVGNFKRDKGLTFDNSGRYKNDGSFVDYDNVLSVIDAYETNAVKHGQCIADRAFTQAAQYAARLFAMREKIKEKGYVSDVASSLMDKGGNVTVWTAGLALSAGVMKDEAAEALKTLRNDACFCRSAELLLQEYGYC